LYGVDTWNELIWERVKSSFPGSGWVLVPIIITVNDYEVELFNGEAGVLVRRLPLGLRYGVEDYAFFPSRENGQVRRISALLLPRHELAYCLSVHKSQGSEFDAIVLLLPEGERMSRELFYTAVTRARKSIEVVASEEVVARVVEQKQRRVSGFSVRFKKKISDRQNVESHVLEK
jgi:exodeoxyribonuclease V alpha subunit